MNSADAKASRNPSQTSFMIKIRIKRNDGSWFTVEVNKYGTILSLKEVIFEKTGYSPESQRLVFAGKVMSDEMTLSFYKIGENSQVYLVPKKTSDTISKQFSTNSVIYPRPKPIQLLNRMMALLRKFRNISAEEYTSTISEINDIINDPSVQSFSRINEDAKQLLKDAQNIISNSERPMSQKTKYFIAKSKDFIFDQFDSTPEGFRILQSLINEDSESGRSSSLSSHSNSSLSASSRSTTSSYPTFSTKNSKENQKFSNENANSEDEREANMSNYNYHKSNFHGNSNKTNIKYQPLISTRPLPNIWSDSQSNDSEEPIKRVKLTRAPGMSFTLLMKSESSSDNENDYDIDNDHNNSFKFEPAPSQVNQTSKVSPTAIPAFQLPPKGNNTHSKRSIFQRTALRMSAPIAPILQANSKNSSNCPNNNTNKKLAEQKSSSNDKFKSDPFSISSPAPASVNLNIDNMQKSPLPISKETAASTPRISIITSCTENYDPPANNTKSARIFGKNLSNLKSKPSLSSPVSDTSLNSEENIPVVKAKSFNEPNLSKTLKSKFAEQLIKLKNMGFEDENIILQALNETNGNVQLAAQLLKNKST